MKFSDLTRGKAAHLPVPFPYITADGAAGEAVCNVRPIDGTEESEALAYGREHGKKHGAADPKDGDALFDLGRMAKTLALACIDPDNPGAPFFDKGPEQVLSLPIETVSFLFEAQRGWQEKVSPTVRTMGPGELFLKAKELAEAEDELPFLRLSPGMRWIFTRTMARLLLSSYEGKFGPTALSETPTNDSDAT